MSSRAGPVSALLTPHTLQSFSNSHHQTMPIPEMTNNPPGHKEASSICLLGEGMESPTKQVLLTRFSTGEGLAWPNHHVSVEQCM